MGDNGEPVRRHKKPVAGHPVSTPHESDEFNSRELGKQWQWHANYHPLFGMTSDLGFIRIYGHPLSGDFRNFWEVPNLLLQKFPAPEFTATAKMTVTATKDRQQSGLIVMGRDYARLSVEKSGDGFRLRLISCRNADRNGEEIAEEVAELPCSSFRNAGSRDNYDRDIWLRVKVENGGLCRFSYSLDGKKFHPAGSPFQAREGKWIGAKVGVFSVQPGADNQRGWTDVDWFRVSKKG